jgi:hypothetical protein
MPCSSAYLCEPRPTPCCTRRVALEVAAKLAAWSPQLPEASGEDGARSRPAALAAACLQAAAGSRVAAALINMLPAAPGELGPTDSAALFRLLTGCASLVLRTSPEVLHAQLLDAQRGSSHQQGPARAQRAVARVLQVIWALLLATANGLLGYAIQLSKEGAAKPVLALLATTCKPAVLHAFWSKCVDVAVFCDGQLGKSYGYQPGGQVARCILP